MLIINDVSHNTAETGRFATTTRGGTLTVTNGYNLRGWLTSIESTPFREYLYYEQPHNGSTAQYGGNISSMDWKTGDNILRGYTFQYDGLSRLTGAAYSENGSASTHYGTSYQYDLMGNITGLTRNGLQDDNSYGLIDNLSFDYNGNQLLKVTDAVTSGPNYSGAFHFNDHSNASIEYTYDANGNMTMDRNKYITSITYNTLNLPVNVLYEDNIYTYSTSYHYAGDGRLLRVNHSLKKIKPLFPFNGSSELDDIQKVVFPGIIKPNPAEMYNGDEFCGSLTYHSGTISYMSVDGGYVTFSGSTPVYHYYLQDHLGNNRVVVKQDGTVEQVNHYYPYGGLMGESTGGDIQKYKYNGKRLERNHGLDWYDYGARHYDAAIISWPTMDPLCEKYYSISPYVYCGDNPINAIDVNGEDNYTINSLGKVSLIKETDDKYDVLMLSSNPNTRITLQDRNILKQLSIRRSDYKGGQYGTTNNFVESAKLFKFVADNTDVEWGFDAFRTSKGKVIFQIRTSNDTDGVFTHPTIETLCNMIFALHSHPRKGGNDYASGDFGSGRVISDYSTPYSDYDTFIRINGSIQNACGKSHPLPRFFLYNARTKNFFEYDFNRSSIDKRRVNTYGDFINDIKRRLR